MSYKIGINTYKYDIIDMFDSEININIMFPKDNNCIYFYHGNDNRNILDHLLYKYKNKQIVELYYYNYENDIRHKISYLYKVKYYLFYFEYQYYNYNYNSHIILKQIFNKGIDFHIEYEYKYPINNYKIIDIYVLFKYLLHKYNTYKFYISYINNISVIHDNTINVKKFNSMRYYKIDTMII